MAGIDVKPAERVNLQPDALFPMKLYWSSRSPFVRKVLIVAHELGIADRITCIPMMTTQKLIDAGLSEFNPISQMPTLLLPDDTAIFDSGVICDFLDTVLGGSRFVPQAQPRRMAALRRQALADGLLEKAVLWLNERGRPEAMRSAEHITAHRQRIGTVLDWLERDLAASGWTELDIGGITTGSAIGYLDFRFGAEDWWTSRPGLRAWYAKFEQRPSVQATVFHD